MGSWDPRTGENYMERAMAPATARYAAEVQVETWGHLAPRPNRAYSGYMIFVRSTYGDTTLINAHWDDLEDSPWLYEDMQEYIDNACDRLTDGQVYRFDGTYRKSRSGKPLFRGSNRLIPTK